MDTLKGTPLAYMSITRVFYLPDETIVFRPIMTKDELVREIFLDHGLNLDMVCQQYQKFETPIFIVAFNGSVVWMNRDMRARYRRGDGELLEQFVPPSGFEEYGLYISNLLTLYPQYYESKNIQFVSCRSTHDVASP